MLLKDFKDLMNEDRKLIDQIGVHSFVTASLTIDTVILDFFNKQVVQTGAAKITSSSTLLEKLLYGGAHYGLTAATIVFGMCTLYGLFHIAKDLLKGITQLKEEKGKAKVLKK